ncbi:MAG: hypothetical protein ABR588_10125 [Sphingomicrobium sp.]|nr:hypothetical protein [Sphingomonadales bacterium]
MRTGANERGSFLGALPASGDDAFLIITADELRELATAARNFAQQSILPGAREALRDLADDYERRARTAR